MRFILALVAVASVAYADYRSGAVSTREHFKYGKFVARMKAPNKKGTVASFFAYKDTKDLPAGWNELDIEIVPSVSSNPLSMNMIYGEGQEKLESHQYAKHFDPKDDWHTYTLEWTPQHISWSVDGRELRHATTSDPAVDHMHDAQSIKMNFWTPTFNSWGRDLVAEDMPWYLLFDYVEVYDYNVHTHDFSLHWRDDFNDFDNGRWFKQSGSFGSNSSIFHTANVYTEKGNLVIKMEPDLDVGHVAHHAQAVEKLVKQVPKQPLHAKMMGHNHKLMAHTDGIEIPAVHDAFVDSHLFSKHDGDDVELVSHSEHEFVDHHDDYEHGEEGDLIVDHHDTHHIVHDDEWHVEPKPLIHHPHHPHSHSDYEHEEVEQPLEHHDEYQYHDEPEIVHEEVHEDRYQDSEDSREPHAARWSDTDSGSDYSDYGDYQEEMRSYHDDEARHQELVHDEEDEWHHDHQTAHHLHPRAQYERETDPFRRTRFDVHEEVTDEYIENPYEFEMEWKATHPHVDHDFEHRYKQHEDHWEEQSTRDKKADKKHHKAAAAPAKAAAPAPSTAPAKKSTDHGHQVAPHHSAEHRPASHHRHPTVHHAAYPHGEHAHAHHAVEAEHLWHGDEHVKTHGDRDQPTHPVYEPHHAKHDPKTTGWMEQFETHEHSHHPVFHTEKKEVEQHHYLDKTHRPYHAEDHRQSDYDVHDYHHEGEHHEYVSEPPHRTYAVHEPEHLRPEYSDVHGYAESDHGFEPTSADYHYEESHGHDGYYGEHAQHHDDHRYYEDEEPYYRSGHYLQ